MRKWPDDQTAPPLRRGCDQGCLCCRGLQLPHSMSQPHRPRTMVVLQVALSIVLGCSHRQDVVTCNKCATKWDSGRYAVCKVSERSVERPSSQLQRGSASLLLRIADINERPGFKAFTYTHANTLTTTPTPTLTLTLVKIAAHSRSRANECTCSQGALPVKLQCS